MRALVTGVAGFIGSHLAEALLDREVDVIGVDSFSSYYSIDSKLSNLAQLRDRPRFTFMHEDLASVDLASITDGVTHVYHQAGQPGVRSSWGSDFETYLTHNILVTQRLLEYFKNGASLSAFVAASSSSVFGACANNPMSEKDLPIPISPYGVSKLAAEQLCTLYASQYGVPTVSLRYFTVFGPRQRPDMLIHRLFKAASSSEVISINGNGEQQRDFTFVDDVVAANLAASDFACSGQGSVFNIGRGAPVTINHLVDLVEKITEAKVSVVRTEPLQGDPKFTNADISKAWEFLRWAPTVTLEDGLKRQFVWHQNQ